MFFLSGDYVFLCQMYGLSGASLSGELDKGICMFNTAKQPCLWCVNP